MSVARRVIPCCEAAAKASRCTLACSVRHKSTLPQITSQECVDLHLVGMAPMMLYISTVYKVAKNQASQNRSMGSSANIVLLRCTDHDTYDLDALRLSFHVISTARSNTHIRIRR